MLIISPDEVTKVIDKTLLPYHSAIRSVIKGENDKNIESKSRENEIETK